MFFFNDTATTEIYTLSLHDALPICSLVCEALGGPRSPARAGSPLADAAVRVGRPARQRPAPVQGVRAHQDRKSTRLNSSHANISYAVFCLKKKIMIS